MKRTRRQRLRTLLAQIAAAAVLVSGISLGAAAAPAEAAADGCINSACGFPWDEWEPAMNKSYWGAYSGHNCTNYVAWRLIRNGDSSTRSGLGSAGSWKSYAESKGITVNTTPAVGAIAWYSWGHVAYVEKVSADKKTITIYEDSYNQKKFRVKKLTVGTSGWPDKFLHFRDIGQNKVMTDNSFRLLNTTGATTLTKYDDMGKNGDIPVAGDWNGNGTDTLGIVRNGTWQLFNGSGKNSPVFSSSKWLKFGSRTKLPFVGDFNGDGLDDIGYKDGGTWYIDYTVAGKPDGKTDKKFTLGAGHAKPIAGDWDGDGVDGVGTVIQDGSKRVWKLWNDPLKPKEFVTFSTSLSDYAVGDWNGDGFDTFGLKGQSKGKDTWTLYNYFPTTTEKAAAAAYQAAAAAAPSAGAPPAAGTIPPEEVEEESDEIDDDGTEGAQPEGDDVPAEETVEEPADPEGETEESEEEPVVVEETPVLASTPAPSTTPTAPVKAYDPAIKVRLNLFTKPTPRDIVLVGSWKGTALNGRKVDSIGLAR